MNNFRRTVREVVYVVKVADMTVAKRIEEFKRTASSDLTIEQFREFGTRLKLSADPPALYEAKLKEEKKKRKLALLLNPDAPEEAFEISGDESLQAPTTRQNSGTPTAESRRDAEGFAIPVISDGPELLGDGHTDTPASPTRNPSEEPPTKKKRGRPPKAGEKAAKPPPFITPEDLVEENELEDEIDTIINDPITLSTLEDEAFIVAQNRAKLLAEKQRAASAAAAAPNRRRDNRVISIDPHIDSDEFDSDPEVRNCVLSVAEQRIKERIWVTHNEDWLRAQQAKNLKKALDEASGAGSKLKQKRRPGRMGDGSVLEGGTPVESPADANQRMLEKRGKGFSKHINYEKLSELYRGVRGIGSGTATAVTTSDGVGSVNGDVQEGEEESGAKVGAGGLITPAATQNANDTGNDKEPEDEEDDEDEDEDEDEEEAEEENDAEKEVMETFVGDGDDFGEDLAAYDDGGDDPYDY